MSLLVAGLIFCSFLRYQETMFHIRTSLRASVAFSTVFLRFRAVSSLLSKETNPLH